MTCVSETERNISDMMIMRITISVGKNFFNNMKKIFVLKFMNCVILIFLRFDYRIGKNHFFLTELKNFL